MRTTKNFMKKISRSYRIYLGFEDQDVSWSDNWGANWSTATGSYTYPLQVIYIRGQGLPNFVGGTNWNVYRGTDLTDTDFSSWADVGEFATWAIFYNPRTLYYYLVGPNGLRRSTNEGTTWAGVTGFGTDSLCLMMDEALWIVGSTANGVYLSTNSGTNVSNYTTTQGLGNNRVNGVILADGVIWAATAGGISKSTNNGAAWTNYTTTQGIIHNNVTGVAYSEPRKRIYCVSNNAAGGISYTDNSGANWSTIIPTVTRVLLGCKVIDDILVIWGTGGMAYSLDGGLTFTNRVTTGIPSTNVRVAQILGTTTFG